MRMAYETNGQQYRTPKSQAHTGAREHVAHTCPTGAVLPQHLGHAVDIYCKTCKSPCNCAKILLAQTLRKHGETSPLLKGRKVFSEFRASWRSEEEAFACPYPPCQDALFGLTVW